MPACDRRRFLSHGACLTVGTVSGALLPRWWAEAPAPGAAAEPPAPTAEDRVRTLKLKLPPVAKPPNSLAAAVRVGDLLYVSGHGPGTVDGKPVVGKVGKELTVKEGQAAARQVGLVVLSVVRGELGSLNKVVRLVKVLGMVNATADFRQHPQVINGFSDLLIEVFGERAGKGARSAVGMASLPGGIPVEIEAIFQVRT